MRFMYDESDYHKAMLTKYKEQFKRPLVYRKIQTGEGFNKLKEFWTKEVYKNKS